MKYIFITMMFFSFSAFAQKGGQVSCADKFKDCGPCQLECEKQTNNNGRVVIDKSPASVGGKKNKKAKAKKQ